MLDMNHLWENYIYCVLKRAARFSDVPVSVEAQRGKPFWRHPGNYDLRLRPDIVVRKNPGSESEEVIVIDTKWKYRSDTSIGDVRQMYAYGRYFGARNTFLLYPDRLAGRALVRGAEQPTGVSGEGEVSSVSVPEDRLVERLEENGADKMDGRVENRPGELPVKRKTAPFINP